MAQRRNTTRADAGTNTEDSRVVDGDFIEHEPDPAEQDAELDLTNLLADIGETSDAQVHVYRQKEGTKKLSWIHTFAPSDLDIGTLFHSLRHELGGGMFRLQVRDHGRIVKSKTIEIEPPSDKEKKAVESAIYGGSPYDPVAMMRELRESSGSNDKFDSIIQMMMQQTRDTQNMIIRMIEAQNNNKPEGMGVRDVIEIMGTLQQLNGSQNKENPIEMFLRGLEVAKEFGGDKETNFFDVLGKSLSTFGGTLQQAMQSGMPGQHEFAADPQATMRRIQYNPNEAAQPTQPNPQPKTQPESETEHTPLPDEHPLKAYEGYILWLIDLAEKDRDPDTYANVIVDQLGEETARTLFTTQQYLMAVAQAFPKVQKYQAWFNDLIAAIDDYTSGSDDSESDTDSSNAHVDARQPFTIEPDPTANRGEHADPQHAHGDSGGAGGGEADTANHGEVGERGKDSDASS